jgi:LL-diaminopimelate aminotransferase
LLVCHDNAYADVSFDGYIPPSFLAVPGAKEVGIELNTFSKGFNMAGWRVGMAVGNAEAVSAVASVGNNTSMGIFGPVQLAAIEALSLDQDWIDERNLVYQERRDIVVEGLEALGLKVNRPQATLYVWAKLPDRWADSFAFSKWLLDQAGIWITSGVFFGQGGEGYIRVPLTASTEDLREAMGRLQEVDLA